MCVCKCECVLDREIVGESTVKEGERERFVEQMQLDAFRYTFMCMSG